MSAKVVQKGFSTVGINESGELATVEVALVLAEVPGPKGELCFVVQGSDFCWVKGLLKGEGYLISKFPLHGPKDSWQQQIQAYLAAGPDAEFIAVAPGTEAALAQENFFIISE